MTESLLLDEHFPPALARLLRQDGFDVIGVSEDPLLIGASDYGVYQAAIEQGRRVVTENVRDFRPLLARSLSNDAAYAPLLLTTRKRYSRRTEALGALASALRDWLQDSNSSRQAEEWL